MLTCSPEQPSYIPIKSQQKKNAKNYEIQLSQHGPRNERKRSPNQHSPQHAHVAVAQPPFHPSRKKNRRPSTSPASSRRAASLHLAPALEAAAAFVAALTNSNANTHCTHSRRAIAPLFMQPPRACRGRPGKGWPAHADEDCGKRGPESFMSPERKAGEIDPIFFFFSIRPNY